MVWFQCEDCGESLKKPKLPNHFRICSAAKLSCIDCCQTFSKESVQGHTQCITESDKYGPKGEAKASNGKTKPSKPNQHPEVDLNVGLSSRYPWECSLCKTTTTSQQTLILHAEGKKHRTKARAFHASQNQPSQTIEPAQEWKEIAAAGEDKEPDLTNGVAKVPGLDKCVLQNEGKKLVTQGEGLTGKKRDRDELVTATESNVRENQTGNPINEKSIQKQEGLLESLQEKLKLKKVVQKQEGLSESLPKKLKLKKLVTRQLKEKPNGQMKLKKLQKLVIKTLLESGFGEDKEQLLNMVMGKINSSSRFVIDNKYVRLTTKTGDC